MPNSVSGPDDARNDPQFYNRNPTGVNQHPNCPRPGDGDIERILREFHSQAITNRKLISQLLRSEYGIIMSETTVSRRRKALGLTGQITAKQFIPKTTQEALRAEARSLESSDTEDLFGDGPASDSVSDHHPDNLPDTSGFASDSPEPLPLPPPRKKRRTARRQSPTPIVQCLVTLESEPPETIGKCYLVGQSTPTSRIRQLEYAWGYMAGTIDLESPSNIIRLRADIRCSFDDGGFVILPDLDTIKRIYRETVECMLSHDGGRPLLGQIFPDKASNTPWTYEFVPIRLLSQNVTIHRRAADATARSTGPTGSTVAAYTLHRSPFSDFPKLKCDAHPFFVIANATEKFRKNVAVVLRYPQLQEIRTILLLLWDLWTLDPPEDFVASADAASTSSYRGLSVTQV